MTYVFLIVMAALLFIQYKREHNIVNCVSILIAPYFIIVLFNKLVFEKLGFFEIR